MIWGRFPNVESPTRWTTLKLPGCLCKVMTKQLCYAKFALWHCSALSNSPDVATVPPRLHVLRPRLQTKDRQTQWPVTATNRRSFSRLPRRLPPPRSHVLRQARPWHCNVDVHHLAFTVSLYIAHSLSSKLCLLTAKLF